MRIAPEQDRRRYEPLGMTTALWQAVYPEPQLIAPLVLQQDSVDIAALLGEKPTLHDEYPHVVVFEGEPYVSDGHHRGKRFDRLEAMLEVIEERLEDLTPPKQLKQIA
jgi:hypothetical protein